MFAKACIVPVDGNGNEGAPIECMFNPREYTVSRTVKWGNQSNDTSEAGNRVYQGGTPASMTLELFFDTYAQRKAAGQVEDVRKYTQRLWALTRIKPGSKSPAANKAIDKETPPKVLFQWGGTWHFAAFIESMEQQFTLFMPDGTPVRSIVKVTLTQADEATHFYGKKGLSTYSISADIRKNTNPAKDPRYTAAGQGRL